MGGIPNHSITSLWNMANFCIDQKCTPSEYYNQGYKDSQAILIVSNARIIKQNQENSKHD